MSSQAGSPPGVGGNDSSLQLPGPSKKRLKKDGGPSKPRGKARAKDADADGESTQQQQHRRQLQASQSGPVADSSLSRSQPAGAGPTQAGNAEQRPAKSQRMEKRGPQKMSRKNLFAKELPALMYAFGDDRDPLPESVNVLEEILVDYLSDLCKSAAAHSPNAKKIRLDDLRFALRQPQQSKQLARLEELLYLQEDIARARKLDFDGIS